MRLVTIALVILTFICFLHAEWFAILYHYRSDCMDAFQFGHGISVKICYKDREVKNASKRFLIENGYLYELRFPNDNCGGNGIKERLYKIGECNYLKVVPFSELRDTKNVFYSYFEKENCTGVQEHKFFGDGNCMRLPFNAQKGSGFSHLHLGQEMHIRSNMFAEIIELLF